MADVARVGGKNASLGQLFNALKPKGVGVLDGFATTTAAYRRLLAEHDLENRLRAVFTDFDPEEMRQLAERGNGIRTGMAVTTIVYS